MNKLFTKRYDIYKGCVIWDRSPWCEIRDLIDLSRYERFEQLATWDETVTKAKQWIDENGEGA